MTEMGKQGREGGGGGELERTVCNYIRLQMVYQQLDYADSLLPVVASVLSTELTV